jgi:hypothetical protein
MRRVREILRLKYECGATERAIARSIGIARSTVALTLERAAASKLSWPPPATLTDRVLEAMLYASADALQGLRRIDLPLQGLPPRRAGAVRHNDTQRRRVHQTLPAPRSTKGVSSDPPLRAAGQRRLQDIARARELMAAPMAEVDPPAVHDTADPNATTDHRPPCPCCGGRMIIVEVFAPGSAPRGPPSSSAGTHT